MMPAQLSPMLPVTLPRHQIDPDAVMVCRRLQEAGFTTYLVGGCVRDIILGRAPKDFDIGTSATPVQVKRLFRNCRLIGRRFRLAHIHFGPKILEVATFRGGSEAAEGEDGAPGEAFEGEEKQGDLIVRANNFGTPEQDALSRDFTVNGLFYDPIDERVIDHVHGYEDIRGGLLRTIGPAAERFREDPVRILRAVKFAARLGFRVEEEALAAMATVAGAIPSCPAPRVTEELYRIAESGYAEAAFRLMRATEVLPVVMPELSDFIDDDPESGYRHFGVLDRLVRAHGGLPRELVMAVLFYPLALRVVEVGGATTPHAWGLAVEEWFRPAAVRMHVSIKHRLHMRTLLTMMGRFLGPPGAPGRRRGRLGGHERRVLPQALTLLRLHYRLYGGCEEAYELWRTLAIDQGLSWVPIEAPPEDADAEESGGAPPRRRRRRGRRPAPDQPG